MATRKTPKQQEKQKDAEESRKFLRIFGVATLVLIVVMFLVFKSC